MASFVDFEVPRRQIGSAGIVFHVVKSDTKLGRLKVSKGGLQWFPKDGKRGHKINWHEFVEMMNLKMVGTGSD
jgi:hypothetical protein